MLLHDRTAPSPQPAVEPPVPQARFLGLPFALLEQWQAIRLILDRCRASYRYVVTPNAYDVATAHDEPARLLPIYRGAWLSLCDSRILRTLARLDGHTLPLVTGSDLVAALLAALDDPAGPPRRLLVVGPPQATAMALRAAYPNIAVEVLPAPFGLAGDAELRSAVARACVEARWDILLLCVGAPAQGLIAEQIARLGRTSGVALCVGAAIDFIVGARPRAPSWLQKLGLEWAYRLLREPRRLWRRYLVDSPKVFGIFLAERLPRRPTMLNR